MRARWVRRDAKTRVPIFGATLKGLWGPEEAITRHGRAVTVGADSIRESIPEPHAAIVRGYEQVPMAAFGGVPSKEQVERLMVFLRDVE